MDAYRKAQTSVAREGKLDVAAELFAPATRFWSAVGAKPSDADGSSFSRVERIWVLGSAGDWRRGSAE